MGSILDKAQEKEDEKCINKPFRPFEKHHNGSDYDYDQSWKSQIGGNHYKDMIIQPMEYSMKNNLNALQHTIIKYVSRYKDKNGVQDLEKAKHCIEMLIDYTKLNP